MIDFFEHDSKLISKGELKYNAGDVMNFRINGQTINARIRSSMKDKCYPVTLIVDGDGGIVEGQCECPQGKWLCSHMAAAAVYTYKKDILATDLPSSGTVEPDKAGKVQTWADLFPNPRPEYRALSREVTPADIAFFHKELAKLAKQGIVCPMLWITGPEPPKKSSDPLAEECQTPGSVEPMQQN